jgi:hypothetical protein
MPAQTGNVRGNPESGNDQARAYSRRGSMSRDGWPTALQRLVYSTLAKTFLAFGRINFAARFRWLLDLLKPRAITGGANNFGQWLTRFFHNDQSLK